tara:strand:- start:15408 stop:15563 length:156 start_codon:yes stop_codon:yes gene_type:complete
LSKVFTITQWCRKNGYGGVTKECLSSAILSENDKIVDMAKKRKLQNLIKDK